MLAFNAARAAIAGRLSGSGESSGSVKSFSVVPLRATISAYTGTSSPSQAIHTVPLRLAKAGRADDTALGTCCSGAQS